MSTQLDVATLQRFRMRRFVSVLLLMATHLLKIANHKYISKYLMVCPHPPFRINFGDFWPTSEPLSAVLGTNVTKELVPNTDDRGSVSMVSLLHSCKQKVVC